MVPYVAALYVASLFIIRVNAATVPERLSASVGVAQFATHLVAEVDDVESGTAHANAASTKLFRREKPFAPSEGRSETSGWRRHHARQGTAIELGTLPEQTSGLTEAEGPHKRRHVFPRSNMQIISGPAVWGHMALGSLAIVSPAAAQGASPNDTALQAANSTPSAPKPTPASSPAPAPQDPASSSAAPLAPTKNGTDSTTPLPPTVAPTTTAPTAKPTQEPTTIAPTSAPTAKPTTAAPTPSPTHDPTAQPTAAPTSAPTPPPTEGPTAEPTAGPTVEPTTEAPTPEPTPPPTLAPTTSEPTKTPTAEPTTKPTAAPTTLTPTEAPTPPPSPQPTRSPTKPTPPPTLEPTDDPYEPERSARPSATAAAPSTAAAAASPTRPTVADKDKASDSRQRSPAEVPSPKEHQRVPGSRHHFRPDTAERNCTESIGKVRKVIDAHKAAGRENAKERLAEHALNQSVGGEEVVQEIQQALSTETMDDFAEVGLLITTSDVNAIFNCETGLEERLEEHERTGTGDTLEQGDIAVQSHASLLDLHTRIAAGLHWGGKLWTDGKVPYCFAQGTPEDTMKAAMEAMAHITKQVPCVTFEEIGLATSGSTCSSIPSVVIQSRDSGCWSYIGMVSGQYSNWDHSQPLNLGVGCGFLGVAVHEFLHALGVLHEQSRSDRDQYISVMEANIGKNYMVNFERESNAYVGTEYDILSLMHYGPYDFSINGGLTVEPKDKRLIPYMGQRSGMSELDVEHVGEMYNCPVQPLIRNKDLAQKLLAGSGHRDFTGKCEDSEDTGFRTNGRSASCNDLKQWCSSGSYKEDIQRKCPVSCYLCDPNSKTPSSTPAEGASNTQNRSPTSPPTAADRSSWGTKSATRQRHEPALMDFGVFVGVCCLATWTPAPW